MEVLILSNNAKLHVTILESRQTVLKTFTQTKYSINHRNAILVKFVYRNIDFIPKIFYFVR